MMRWALFAVLAGALGCGSLSSYTARPDDYAAYRSTRVAPSFEARLQAASTYLERFPEGEFEPEVRAFFNRAEPVFFAVKSRSIQGLEQYLRLLPDGPHGSDALAELKRLRQAKAESEELSSATKLGVRLSILAEGRARVRSEVEAWIRRFLDRAAWDRPLSQAPDELIVAWRLALPEPVCGPPIEGDAPNIARRCSKLVELPYTVVGDKGPEELQATIEIALTEDVAGRPLGVTIGGPDLFLRIEETVLARAVPREDQAARLRGASRVVDAARRHFQERVSADPTCKKPAASPALLRLDCNGFRVSVRMGSDGEDDTIQLNWESISQER
ncbi:MAG: hypothetical protein HUU21_31760 [Polyangiaceae bacterium]|nr:hypothetical protein [Polyangiaceae bacterium]